MPRRFLLAGCMVLGLVLGAAAVAAEPAVPALIPLPASIDMGNGSFRVDAKTPIVLGDASAATRRVGQQLAERLAAARHWHPTLQRKPLARAITLVLDPAAAVAAPEGYTLKVTADGIALAARDEAGLYYAAMTLAQLLTPDAGQGAVDVPQLSISDQPRFAWRGVMLDSVRHFQSVADIERLIDQMAALKLNSLHWHLTDDQGWRIEIKRYPELTRIGAWRTPPAAGEDGEPNRYGGFYSQAEIRRVVAYAAARHVAIVPELDMPGHAQAAIASYPELGVTGTRPQVGVDWGVNPWLYNVDEDTFGFLQHVLDEVMALFPGPYIHVGGDEAIKDQWQASPAVQARMRALGIDNEDALQGWFISRLGKYLESHGRRLVGWDEILEGGVPTSAVVMSWRGTAGAVVAAQAGHDVVLSPAPDLYLDELQSAAADEQAGRMPVRTLADVYAFEPVPPELDAAQARRVLGAQGNAWTEHMPSMAHVERAMFPRIAAIAETGWTPRAAKQWPGFVARLPAQFARWRAAGIGFADSAFAPDIRFDRAAALASGWAGIAIDNQAGQGELRYTLDGSTPGAGSTLYRGPFALKLPAELKVATFAADGTPLAAARDLKLDHASLHTFDGNLLPNCPGEDFRLRVQPLPDATGLRPTYSINVFDSCLSVPPTALDDVRAISVDAVRLERNFGLAHEQPKVVRLAHEGAFGDLVIRRDDCQGPELARIAVPDPATTARRFTLRATVPAQTGEHALCVRWAAPIDGPLYTVGTLHLETVAQP